MAERRSFISDNWWLALDAVILFVVYGYLVVAKYRGYGWQFNLRTLFWVLTILAILALVLGLGSHLVGR